MKKLLISFIFIVLALEITGQSAIPEAPLSKEYFHEKSKRRKTAAWTFFGIGTAAIGGGLLIATPHRDDPLSELGGVYSGSLLVVGGIFADLISVPLFISASKSKKQAAAFSASIKIEDLSPALGSVLHQNAAPAVSMKFRF